MDMYLWSAESLTSRKEIQKFLKSFFFIYNFIKTKQIKHYEVWSYRKNVKNNIKYT